MALIDCEIAHMIIELNGNVTTINVPAYTRSSSELEMIGRQTISEYLSLTENAGTGGSLADMALYMLSKAAHEPTQQEDDEDG